MVELDGVVEQLIDDLDQGRARCKRQRRRLAGHRLCIQAQTDAVRRGGFGRPLGSHLQKPRQRDGLGRLSFALGTQPRQVEHVVDQGQQVFAGAQNALYTVNLLAAERLCGSLCSKREKPSTAFKGVRNSWLMRAMNSVLARLASSARCISRRNRWARWRSVTSTLMPAM